MATPHVDSCHSSQSLREQSSTEPIFKLSSFGIFPSLSNSGADLERKDFNTDDEYRDACLELRDVLHEQGYARFEIPNVPGGLPLVQSLFQSAGRFFKLSKELKHYTVGGAIRKIDSGKIIGYKKTKGVREALELRMRVQPPNPSDDSIEIETASNTNSHAEVLSNEQIQFYSPVIPHPLFPPLFSCHAAAVFKLFTLTGTHLLKCLAQSITVDERLFLDLLDPPLVTDEVPVKLLTEDFLNNLYNKCDSVPELNPLSSNHSVSEDDASVSSTVMRLCSYRPRKPSEDSVWKKAEEMGRREVCFDDHVDVGVVTLELCSNVPGLQIFKKYNSKYSKYDNENTSIPKYNKLNNMFDDEGYWEDAEIVNRPSLVIMIGETLSTLTKNYFPACRHRVCRPAIIYDNNINHSYDTSNDTATKYEQSKNPNVTTENANVNQQQLRLPRVSMPFLFRGNHLSKFNIKKYQDKCLIPLADLDGISLKELQICLDYKHAKKICTSNTK